MAQTTGIQDAVEMMGSPAKLAEAVGHGCLRQHVEYWLRTGQVSTAYAPRVAAATGVQIERLNDRMDWGQVVRAVRSSQARRTATTEKEV